MSETIIQEFEYITWNAGYPKGCKLVRATTPANAARKRACSSPSMAAGHAFEHEATGVIETLVVVRADGSEHPQVWRVRLTLSAEAVSVGGS